MRNIIVNSRPVPYNLDTIWYQDVIELTGRKYNDDIVYTVTFYRGLNGAQGSLTKGQNVQVVDGMIFNVTVTNNA